MNRLLPYLAIALTAVLWGTTGTAATFNSAGPLAIGAAALGVGGLLQGLIYLPAVRRHARDLPWREVALGAAAIFVYPLCFYSAMHLAGVAVGTVVSLGLAPMFAGVLSRVFQGTLLDAQWWLSSGLGLAGCAVLSLSKDSHGEHFLLGIGLGVLAALSYAAYSLIAGHVMSRGVPRPAAMGAIFGAGGLLLLPVLLVLGHELVTPHNLPSTLYLTLVPMFLGYVLFGIGLEKVPAHIVMVITLAEPAVATLLAVCVVGETLSAPKAAGIGLIGAALLVLAVPSRRRR